LLIKPCPSATFNDRLTAYQKEDEGFLSAATNLIMEAIQLWGSFTAGEKIHSNKSEFEIRQEQTLKLISFILKERGVDQKKPLIYQRLYT